MVNGLGVLGWGVGGIEAEAALLGEAVSMLVPQVVGFRLSGELPRGRDRDRSRAARDRDAARARRGREVRRVLRPRARARCRSPTARRSRTCRPEYGATCGFFPVDEETLDVPAADRADATSGSRSSRPTARSRGSSTTRTTRPTYTQVVELDLGDVEPSLAGPRRPQDRVPLGDVKESFRDALEHLRRRPTRTGRTTRRAPTRSRRATRRPSTAPGDAEPSRPVPSRTVADARAATVASRSTARTYELGHGAVVIAAITSCTNTSNPSVMIARRPAREEGGRARPDAASRG